jgi:hypothetical protein
LSAATTGWGKASSAATAAANEIFARVKTLYAGLGR